MNAPELGDSEGARRRIDSVRGVNVLARVKRCRNGFNTFEGIGWLMDGVKRVGGSYLGERLLCACTRLEGEMSPYTHEEDIVSPHRDIPLVLEDVGKPEQTPPITRRALREHDDRTGCSLPHLFQTHVFLLVIGGL